NNDLKVGGIKRSVIVAAVPKDDIGFLLRLAEDLFVVHASIDHRAEPNVRFILFALLDGALLQIEILKRGKTLDGLLSKVSVGMGWRMTTGLRPCSRSLAAT